jgi:hypothetical protein
MLSQPKHPTCANGHKWTIESTNIASPSPSHPRPYRQCRICKATRNRRYYIARILTAYRAKFESRF